MKRVQTQIQQVNTRSQTTRTYTLGFGGLVLVPTSILLFYVLLGYGLDLVNAVRAGIVLLFIVVGIVLRVLVVNHAYKISPRPIVKGLPFKLAIGLGSFLLLGLTQPIVTKVGLPLPSPITPPIVASFQTTLIIVGGVALGEEVLIRYLVFFGTWIAGLRLFKNYVLSGIIALVLSSTVWYGIHAYVIGADFSSATLFILLSGINLGTAYWTTGSIELTMGEHLVWDIIPVLKFFGVI